MRQKALGGPGRRAGRELASAKTVLSLWREDRMATTFDRVPAHTSDEVNRKIEAQIAENVRQCGTEPLQISARLSELAKEWDIERAIEANASALAFVGVMLGYFAHPYWLILPALVMGFLFQHAIQGWCPPIPVLRRLGFRTAHEIEIERNALKAIRGDYDSVSQSPNRAAAALQAARI
jgi:hypothetical protein